MGLITRNGVYYIRLIQDGKLTKFSLRTRNQSFAQDLYHSFMREKLSEYLPLRSSLQNNRPHYQPAEKPLLKKQIKPIFNNYVGICKMRNLAHSTMIMKNYLLKILVELKIQLYSDFNQSKMNTLITHLQGRYSSDSVKKFISEIKAFLNYSIKQGHYERSDYEKLTFPNIKTKARDTVMTKEDFNRIEEYLTTKNDIDFLMYIKFLWYVGCRPAEATALKPSDIDLETHTVRIFMNKVKKEHITVIPKVYLEELKQYISENNIQEYIFQGKYNGYTFYTKKFKKLKDRLNLNPLYNCYCLRHTFATNLINATGDLHLVSMALGHSNTSITSKHYLNRNVVDMKDKIDASFSEK